MVHPDPWKILQLVAERAVRERTQWAAMIQDLNGHIAAQDKAWRDLLALCAESTSGTVPVAAVYAILAAMRQKP